MFIMKFWLWFAWKIVLLQYRKQPMSEEKEYTSSCDLLEKSYFCSIANNVEQSNRIILLVVICLKNRTFAVSQTTQHNLDISPQQLWFAWKIVLLQYRKQLSCKISLFRMVVICLKNRTFAVSQTTRGLIFKLAALLWFAWKIVLLQYRKQQSATGIINDAGCDLLEKSYFCSIANNTKAITHFEDRVVICLKNRTFAVSQTTWMFRTCSKYRLWFAWKIVLLQYRKQRNMLRGFRTNRCDLLEKSYFCSIANNHKKYDL